MPKERVSSRSCGFTMIELLAVIVNIAMLAAMLLPALARAKWRAQATQCLNNLKQSGAAVQMYVEDNHDVLPGPVWAGAVASYDKDSSLEFIYHVATYIGSPSPSARMVVCQSFVCPSYLKSAPSVTSVVGRKVYLLNDAVDANPLNKVSPFGYPSPLKQPLKYSAIDNNLPRSQLMAITDVDQSYPGLNPSVSWWSDLPNKPVHGAVRNQLFFDWHAQAVKW